jgi:hypothetical protein
VPKRKERKKRAKGILTSCIRLARGVHGAEVDGNDGAAPLDGEVGKPRHFSFYQGEGVSDMLSTEKDVEKSTKRKRGEDEARRGEGGMKRRRG